MPPVMTALGIWSALTQTSYNGRHLRRDTHPMLVSIRLLTAALPSMTLTSHAAATDIAQLMADGEVPGLAIATIRNGLVDAFNYGVRSTRTGMSVAVQTVFEAASLGKPVFAYMVLQLVDVGTLLLNQKVADILPDPVPGDPRAAQITVREILSHTSGLANWRHDRLRTYFDGGTRLNYSGEGFILLQRVVEKITGEKLEAIAKRPVFDPLGTHSTSYV
jgi:CubicO group peptidase (beta-lactamase class C family)